MRVEIRELTIENYSKCRLARSLVTLTKHISHGPSHYGVCGPVAPFALAFANHLDSRD